MPLLGKDKAAAIVAAYRDDESLSFADVAAQFSVAESSVHKALDDAGVVPRTADASDEDLGIGMDIGELTSSQVFKDAVAEAVAQAMAAQGGKAPRTNEPGGNVAWDGLMEKLERMVQGLDIQKPGYQKPLTPDERSSRDRGKDKFFALLRQVRRDVAEYGKAKAVSMGLVPSYIVGRNGFYGMTAAGEMLFRPGQQVYQMAPPPEDFLPMNECAGAIMVAQAQWLGEPTPDAGELIAQALVRAHGGDPAFLTAAEQVSHADDVELIPGADAEVDVGPRRMMGSSVAEEPRRAAGPRPLAGAAPAGPTFIDG